MRKYFASQSGIFNARVLLAFALSSVGVLLGMFSFAGMPSAKVTAFSPASLASPTTNFSNGITFDHANLNDPMRMVGEPDIEIDHNGGIYVSGPWGTPTQTSWFWKSDDQGINWHTIGVLPAKSNGQNGGGDTEITIAKNNDVFGSDAQTTLCNSTFRSFDAGKTFLTAEACVPATDRNWMGIYDPNGSATGRRIYLSGNSQTLVTAVFGCYVLVSTDNGVTYQPPAPMNNPSAQIDGNNASGCIGRFAVDPANGDIFAPASGGTTFVSTDGALTWTARGSNGAQGNFFAPIKIDTAGNLWQAWTAGTQTFLSYSTDRGFTWHSAIRVSTGPGSPIGTSPDLRQVLFPWLAVGDPGRVAVIFYGTTDTGSDGGFPGSVNALWHAYATFSTNAMDPSPTFTQVQATEHVMHRGGICNIGVSCLTANGDRSMADFFMVDKDTQGRVFIAYNENSDMSQVVPPNAQFPNGQYIGKPLNAVIRLRTGPSLFAAQGNLLPLPMPANVAITSASASGGTISVAGTQGLPPGNWTTDPAGDAIFPVVPTAGPNFGAMDILEASVSDDGTNLTVKMKLADLSQAATATAAPLGPSWMVTWWEGKAGVGPPNMTSGPFHSHWFVQWLGGTAFVFGEASSVNYATLGAPQPRVMAYVPTGTATGSVVGNVVTMSVPLASLGGLTAGDKIDHIHAYALSNQGGGDPLFPVDQAKSFSYVIGTPTAAQHLPDGYVQVSLDNFATSALATLNPANNTWTASIPGNGGTVCARQVLAKNLYTPLWDDVQAGPVACFNNPIPVLTSVVSRMTHGGITMPPFFDINFPLPPMASPRGVECRSSASLGAGNYKLVFTFTQNLTSVASVSTPTHDPATGTGTVSSNMMGPNANQYTVNLTGVSTGQYITVTLNSVLDATGASGNILSPQMGFLVGDVNFNGVASNADVSLVKAQVAAGASVGPSNFQDDVNANGVLTNADVSLTKAQVAAGAQLPSPP